MRARACVCMYVCVCVCLCVCACVCVCRNVAGDMGRIAHEGHGGLLVG
jgi:hypothetical protein